jgi:hypothetical protein
LRCRTVDSRVEKLKIAGDNRAQPVGCRWTTPSPACGSRIRPQPVDIFRPRIHNHLTWSDRLAPTAPVDTVWTTSRSPGCGREKVPKSVEGGRNPGGIRTPGVGFGGLEQWPTPAESAPVGLGKGFGGTPEGLQSGSRTAPGRLGSGPRYGCGSSRGVSDASAHLRDDRFRRPPVRLRHDEGRPGRDPGAPSTP